MSIASDIRSYADTALAQGKQVVDQAQAQFNEVTGSVTASANELVGKLTGTAKENFSGVAGKATETVNDLRVQAEKALNVEAIKTAVEPYLAQAKDYSTSVTDRAGDLFSTVKNDKRVASLLSTAEGLSGTVVETVQERVVKPVQSLTGLGVKSAPAAPQSKPSPKPAPVKASATPAAPAKAATVKKATPAKKAPAKKAPGTGTAK